MSKTNATGQLRPLSERLTPAQQDARDAKIWARRTVAEKLGQNQMIANLSFAAFVQMPFLMRVRWMLFGHLPKLRIRRA